MLEKLLFIYRIIESKFENVIIGYIMYYSNIYIINLLLSFTKELMYGTCYNAAQLLVYH